MGLLLLVALVGAGIAIAWLVTRSPDLSRLAYVRSPFDEVADANVHLQEGAGWDQAQRDHDFEAVDLTPRSDPARELDALADSGGDLVLVNVDLFDRVGEVAATHPGTRFVVFGAYPFDFGLPNVTTVYADDDAAGSYLAGAAAALTTQTGIVGFFGAHQPINESSAADSKPAPGRSTRTSK